MAWVDKLLQMEIYMKGIGMMLKNMVQENMLLLMAPFHKDNGLMTLSIKMINFAQSNDF